MAVKTNNTFSMSPISAKLLNAAREALQKDDATEAIKLCKKAIRTDAKNSNAWYFRALASAKAGLVQDAKDCFKKTLQFGKHPDFFMSAAGFFYSLGDLQRAEQRYQDCAKLYPDFPDVFYALGSVYSDMKRLEDAEICYKKGLELNPEDVRMLVNLASLYVKQQKLTEALPLLQKAHQLAPDVVQPKFGLGEVYEKLEQYDKSIEMYRSGEVWGPLLRVMRMAASWDGLDKVDKAYIETEAYKANGSPLSALSIPSISAELQRVIARYYAISNYKNLEKKYVFPKHKYGERLKIGYLSADFCQHATMRLFAKVLALHDPEELEVHLFKHGPRRDEHIDLFLQGLPLQIHEINDLSDFEAAQLINRLGIQILVDLKGYTQDNRLEITALRPAPIIVSWLGYPGTLGHEALADYIIGDPIVTPREHAHHFSEKIITMPHCYQPNDNDAPIEPAITREEAGLPETGFIFCSFNQLGKLNPEMFSTWCRLLKSVEGSYLWLLEPKIELAKNNLKRELAKHGVNEDALIFAEKLSISPHLRRLKCADLALDSFPYNSHTTASDALWCNVPLVTLMGETFASRVAASLLTTHGFPELIARSYDEFYEKAHFYATNSAKMHELKQRLSEARLSSMLFNSEQFALDLKELYKQIWKNHLASNPLK